jgi:hypothetical protein
MSRDKATPEPAEPWRSFLEEVRPYLLGNLPWHDKTVELWLTMASLPRVP